MSAPVLTLGHSTRERDEVIRLLNAHEVGALADVRTIPRSRRVPDFNREALADALRAESIAYVQMHGLGGLRRPRRDSPNMGWRNASFRGFADYMLAPEFEATLTELMGLVEHGRVALLCAEAVPWRCHRSLIADALVVRGIEVVHLMGGGRLRDHELTPWARVEGTRITYPAGAESAR